jgi:hypothetical protein
MTNNEQELKRAAMYRSRMSAFYGMAIMYNEAFMLDSNAQPPPPVKPCLRCGKLKQHNNAFCSADCCRAWKRKPNDNES